MKRHDDGRTVFFVTLDLGRTEIESEVTSDLNDLIEDKKKEN